MTRLLRSIRWWLKASPKRLYPTVAPEALERIFRRDREERAGREW